MEFWMINKMISVVAFSEVLLVKHGEPAGYRIQVSPAGGFDNGS